jgi:hypothetical protein
MTKRPRAAGKGGRKRKSASAATPPRSDTAALARGTAIPAEQKSAKFVARKEPAGRVPGPPAPVLPHTGATATGQSPTIGPQVTAVVGGGAAPIPPRRLTVRGVRIDPIPPIVVSTEPGPLLLLPLRLEYRLVTRGGGVIVVDPGNRLETFAAIDKKPAEPSIESWKARLTKRRQAVSDILKQADTTKELVLAGQQELWFRWYPDESFARKGIPPASPAETVALGTFPTKVGSRPWYDPADPDVAAAWQDFASVVGPYRGIHLVRSRSAVAAGRYEEDIGRITALPGKVTLFAVTGQAIAELGSGSAIPANASGARSQVSYTPEAVQPAGWMRDFAFAQQLGMALRITDATTVNKALEADQIIAIGQFDGDAKSELGDLLKDGIANGAFSFLRQDTPTNNGPGVQSGLVDPRGDPNGFLKIATQNEAGAFAGGADTAADLLAQALALEPAITRDAVHSADTAFADAKAMLRVIGPAILDGALDGATVIAGVDENTFIDELAKAGVARGALSAMRFGNNPFGILPMTIVGDLAIDDADRNAASVQGLLKSYAAFARDTLPQYAERVVPVLEPDDAQAAGKLEAVLKSDRVSRRIDVADVGSSATAPIGCPYVSGATPQTAPLAYLEDLVTKALRDLPDPSNVDTATPLLYRLARMTLTLNIAGPMITPFRPATGATARGVFETLEDSAHRGRVEASGLFGRTASDVAAGRGLTGIDQSVQQAITRLNAEFVAAIRQLQAVASRLEGIAELEMLLLETVDLLQHRIDAIAAGLAHARLVKQRQANNARLQAGYFGFLGKPRPASATGASDGYVQAPSMAQATTAAILRSAFLRHAADGAFALDLGSRRVRRALTLLDVLKKGITLEEALGWSGERWLHNNQLSRLTLDIRAAFPFVNPMPPESRGGAQPAAPGPAGLRVFDGLKFISGGLTAFAAADRPALQSLQKALADDLDSLSDLVLAEAVHRRAMGHAEAAKSWMNLLSGTAVPGDPIFTRTQRHGQGSTYRISILATPATIPADAVPREMAEPTLAAIAGDLLPDFASLSAVVTLSRLDDPARRHSLSASLVSVLGIRPIDLVIGGRSELRVRLRSHAIATWLTDPAISADIGPPAGDGLAAFVNRTVNITIDDSPTGPSVATALGRAEKLRSLVSQGRIVEPSDLNAAASPANALDEPQEVALIVATIEVLRVRVAALHARLTADLATLGDVQARFMQNAREARRRLDADGRDPALPGLLAAAELSRRDLYTMLRRVTGYAEPAALRPFTVEEAIGNPDALAATLDALAARLMAKARRLGSAQASTAGGGRLEDARAARRALIEALQAALDGDALAVFPPIARLPATTPLLDAPGDLSTLLGAWTAVRSRVALAAEISALLPGLHAHPVAAAATADDQVQGDQDQRPEPEAPRARHFGTLLGTDAALAGSSLAGFVCDEWADQRPSRIQLAAMAVNHESPASQAPQCMILCMPPHPQQVGWTDAAAAQMVFEAIQWMKVRALSTDDKPWPASLLPRANQVAFNGTTRRIPQRPFWFVDLGFTGFENQFLVADAFQPGDVLGQRKDTINESTGFRRVKE